MSETLNHSSTPSPELNPQAQIAVNNPAIETYSDAINDLRSEITKLSVIQRVGAGVSVEDGTFGNILQAKADRTETIAALGDLIHVHEHLADAHEASLNPVEPVEEPENDPFDAGLFDGDIFQGTDDKRTFYTIKHKKLGEENVIAVITESASSSRAKLKLKPATVEMMSETEAVEMLRQKAALIEPGFGRQTADEMPSNLDVARSSVAAALEPKEPKPTDPPAPARETTPPPPALDTPPPPALPPEPPRAPAPAPAPAPATETTPPPPPPEPAPTRQPRGPAALVNRLVSSAFGRGNRTSESTPTQGEIVQQQFEAHQAELKAYYANLTKAFSAQMSPNKLVPAGTPVDSETMNKRVAELVNITLYKGDTVDVYPDGTMVKIPVETLAKETAETAAAKAAGLRYEWVNPTGLERKKLAAEPFFSTLEALRDAKSAEGHVHGDLSELPDVVLWTNKLDRLVYVSKPRIIETVDGMTIVGVATRLIKNRDDVQKITNEQPLSVDSHPYKHKEEYQIEFFTVPGEHSTLEGIRASQLEIIAGQSVGWNDERMQPPMGIQDSALINVSDAVSLVFGMNVPSVPERGEGVPESLPQPEGWAPYHTRYMIKRQQRQAAIAARFAEEQREAELLRMLEQAEVEVDHADEA